MTMKGVQSLFIGLIVAVGLAFIIPHVGASGGWLRTEITLQVGVFIMFFLQGLLLRTDELKRGLLQWRLHLFCQVVIFGVIPILFFLMTWMAGPWLSPELKVGFLFLAILPSTLSTAVIFTSLASGNVAGALFNTSVSNIAGIFIVPALATLITAQVGAPQPILPLLVKIVSLLLLPFVLGQCLRPMLAGIVTQQKTHFGTVNTYIVYFIVFATSCNAVQNRFWESQGLSGVLLTLGLTVVMLLLVTGLVLGGTRAFRFERPDAIAALFCTSQKTLAAGVPMAQSIFGNESQLELGLVILPLMFYHLLQLVLGGALIKRFEQK